MLARRPFSLCIASAAVFAFPGCRTGAGASQELAAGESPRGVVIVYMGGFNSCTHDTPRGLAGI